jgi:hypothetical protein
MSKKVQFQTTAIVYSLRSSNKEYSKSSNATIYFKARQMYKPMGFPPQINMIPSQPCHC